MKRAAEPDATPSLDDEIEWAGLRFFLPSDWQIVAHSLDAREGSLRIVDRRVQRLIVSWTTCRSEPDLERLLSDQRSKLSAGGEGSGFEPFEHGPFRGLRHRGRRGERVTRAVRFHAPHSRLVEALFVDPGAAFERGLQRGWLDRFESTAAPAEARRWCAFGLDVTVPAGLRLERALVKPAQATFALASERGEREAVIRRLGMARHWFGGELLAVVQRHWPKTVFRGERRAERSIELEGEDGSMRFGRWLGRRRLQRTRAWHSQREDAVYEVTTRSPARAPLLPSDFLIGGDAVEGGP